MSSKRPSLKVKKPKERWLLTRKTWRYMADAGRRLIPEGTSNTQEDLPVLEANFQDVCRRENRFLLWRKCSYPSALKHTRTSVRKAGKGLKSRAGSATELELSTACSRLRGENKGRNSLPGVPKSWLTHRSSGKGHGQSSRGGGGGGDWSAEGAEAVFETEEDDLEDEVDKERYRDEGGQQRSSHKSREERDAHGGVRKRLSHFWKGTSDTIRHGTGLSRTKTPHNKGHKSAESSQESVVSVHVSDWQHEQQNLTTSDNDLNQSFQSEELRKIRLRKTSSIEHTDKVDTTKNIRYGVGNLPRIKSSSRESLKLRHVERGDNVSFERSISMDQRLPSLQYSHDNRDYFDEEAESSWSLDRSSFPHDKHHHRQHELSSSPGGHVTSSSGGSYNISSSIERLPSRHNLTLPGLNIARPASRSHDINTSNYTTNNLQPTQRTRRSGKVDHDFFSFQSHLSNWKPSSNSGDINVNKSTNYTESLSPISPTQQQSTTTSKPPSGIKSPKAGPKYCDQGTQTLTVSDNVMRVIENELQIQLETVLPPPVTSPTPPKPVVPATRRKSSVDSNRGGTASVTEDCSPSVGDTILRYLRMARKKSNDADKADRFKTVNYDRTLRYIKSKTPIEDENIKNIQTDESWLKLSEDPNLFDEQNQDDSHFFSSDQESSDLGFASSSRVGSSRSSFDAGELVLAVPTTNPTSPQSPGSQSPSTGHSFLAQLLHGLQQAAGNPHMSLPTAMQKSKSSSSVGHHAPRLMAKKIWRTRSKSQSRATPSTTSTWTPQGQCRWNSVTGRSVTLQTTSLLHLSELERKVLQQVALAKLQALNLGVNIRIPTEESMAPAPKPKRRAYLLKRKALTTGFFDSGRKEGDKDKEASSSLVFGIPLSQCIANDRLSEEARLAANNSSGTTSPAELRRRSHHGSRTSFSSLGDTARTDQGGSCESLPAGRPGVAGSVPGLLDVLSSVGGGTEEQQAAAEWPPSVPHVVATCCRHIMQHGLHTLGIFRVSSSKKRVRQLREDFDCGRDTEMGADLCPHDAATLLKEFFRDLPEPLMSRELYPAFVQTQRIRNRRLQSEALQHLIQLLPVSNRDTLAALLAFLNTVAKHATDRRDTTGEWLLGNKMDSTNLATLFAPNILHCFRPNSSAKEAAAERPEDRTDAINVTRSLIDHHSEIFEVSAELLDEVYLHMMDSHPDALDQLLRKFCFGGDDMPDDGDNNSVFEGSESSSVPRTPTEGPATPVSISVDDKDARGWSDASRKVYSREEFLHETAGMGGPDVGMAPSRQRGRERSKKRGKEEPSEGTSSRWFSHQGSKKREKSSSDESRRRSERGSSSSGGGIGAPSEPATPISSPPGAPSYPASRSTSIDESQASTIIAMSGRSEQNSGSGNVITASLKIPVPASSFALSLDDIPYIEDDRAISLGRRSVDSSSLHTARPSTDSAIGSTISPAPGSEGPMSASGLSSPPSIPTTPTPGDETPNLDDAGMMTTGRILIPALSSTKITTVLRKVEVTTKSSPNDTTVERRPSAKISKEDKKKYTRRRYTDSRHPTVQFPDVEALESAAASAARPETGGGSNNSKPSQVWKRRELIASADPKEHETFV